jgi:hypothetical protein
MEFYGLPPIGQKQRRPMDGAQFHPLWVGEAGGRLKGGAEKVGRADETPEEHPSGAEARPLFCCICGTAEAVPLQSKEFFGSLSDSFHRSLKQAIATRGLRGASGGAAERGPGKRSIFERLLDLFNVK